MAFQRVHPFDNGNPSNPFCMMANERSPSLMMAVSLAIPTRAPGNASEHGEGGKEHGPAWSGLGQDSLVVLRF